MRKYKLLVKFPTRQRPNKFFECMDMLLLYTKDKENTIFKITADEDDLSMNCMEVREQIIFYKEFYNANIEVTYGKSENKIHAVNRDIDSYKEPWDIVLLTSDDMVPMQEGYDEILRSIVERYFPDTDGVVYSPDGYTPLNTLPILGRKYYDRFDYIYHPNYKSFFCDNELHSVAEMLGKHYKIKEVLFRHDHPCNVKVPWDDLYEKNNADWQHDQDLFNERLKRRFDL